jgi:hypothetical protein
VDTLFDAHTGTVSESPSQGEIYAQLNEIVRATDEISFKLLGLVPIVSAAGIGLFAHAGKARIGATIFVSAFAAVATRALYLWERRNIGTCRWARDEALRIAGVRGSASPSVGGRRVGKTEAEQLLYGATFFAWLAFPGRVAWHDHESWSGYGKWYAFAVLLVAVCIAARPGSAPSASRDA